MRIGVFGNPAEYEQIREGLTLRLKTSKQKHEHIEFSPFLYETDLINALFEKKIGYVVFEHPLRCEADSEFFSYSRDNTLSFVASIATTDKVYHVYELASHSNKHAAHPLSLISRLHNISLFSALIVAIETSLILYGGHQLWGYLYPIENSPKIVETLFAIVSFGFSLLTARWVTAFIKHWPFLGYWKYYVSPLIQGDEKFMERVRTSLPRIARIRYREHSLFLEGKLAGNNKKHFQSILCQLVDNKISESGEFFYCYTGEDFRLGFEELSISGSVVLSWRKEKGRVRHMTGWYAGLNSHIIGKLSYQRISKDEYNNLARCYHDMTSTSKNAQVPSS